MECSSLARVWGANSGRDENREPLAKSESVLSGNLVHVDLKKKADDKVCVLFFSIRHFILVVVVQYAPTEFRRQAYRLVVDKKECVLCYVFLIK